jgi:hypothetical protein
MSVRRRRQEPVPQLLEEYLARGPETATLPLATRSAVVLARSSFLVHGVMARGWSVGWLALFLACELLLVLLLMRLGNRIAPIPGVATPAGGGTGVAAFWAALALGATYLAGLRLEASSGGLWFGDGALAAGAGGGLSWAVAGYLGLELADWGREVAVARAGRRRFVSTSTISAAFFFVALCVAPILYFLLVYALAVLSRDGIAHGALGLTLVLAKLAAELGVVWFPRLAKANRLRPRDFGSSPEAADGGGPG